MSRHPWKRCAAWAIDWCCIALYAVALAAVALPLHRAGVTDSTSLVVQNLISAVLLVAPVVAVLAAQESGSRGATLGKRAMGLRVVSVDGGSGYAQLLKRNAVKVGVPWLVGHVAVYQLVTSSTHDADPPWWVWPVLAVSYVVPLVWVGALCVRSGRTPYDVLAGTRVDVVQPRPLASRRA